MTGDPVPGLGNCPRKTDLRWTSLQMLVLPERLQAASKEVAEMIMEVSSL